MGAFLTATGIALAFAGMGGPGAVRTRLVAGWAAPCRSWLETAQAAPSEINLTVSTKEGSAVMNVHPIGEPGAITISAGDQTIAALRRITVEQLLHLGKRQWCT